MVLAARVRPASGVKASRRTVVTAWSVNGWPIRVVASGWLVSHNTMCESKPPVASILPSGEKASAASSSECLASSSECPASTGPSRRRAPWCEGRI